MATLEEVYRDVVSRVNELNLEHGIYFHDYIKAINDSIVLQRSEYVKKGLGRHLSFRENIYFTAPDLNYPFLNSATLAKEILHDVPVDVAIIANNVWLAKKQLGKTERGYTEGSVVLRTGRNFVAVEEVPESTASYNRIFNSAEIRNYKRANGLKYKKGDVVKDASSAKMFRLRSDYNALLDREIEQIPILDVPILDSNGAAISTGSGEALTTSNTFPILPVRDNERAFEPIYWRDSREGFVTAVYKRFENLQEMKLVSAIPNQAAMTIKGSTLYVTPNVSRMVIDYIPEWEYQEDLSVTLDLPASVISTIKIQAVQIITSHKLGRDAVDDRIKRTAGVS